MSLWLCIRFELLPLEALLAQQGHTGDSALIVATQRRVLMCNEQASLAGVQPEQSTSTAQALLADSEHRVLERSREVEEALLEQLSIWAYGISPHLQRWRDNALMIEIGSCLTLHHGLETLLGRIETDMRLRGLTICTGVAETQHAAWLLSHAERDIACQPAAPLIERLAPLPLHLIAEDFPQVVKRLEKAGIRQFEQLLNLPITALGKRCGESFVHWLNQLQGHRQEPAVTYRPPEHFEDTLWFGFDIQNQQELHPAMKQLLAHFCRFLINTQLTSNTIEWRYLPLHLKHVSAPPNSPAIQRQEKTDSSNTAFTIFSETAQHNAALWFELSCLQLENQSFPEGIEGLSLVVTHLQKAVTAPQDLFHVGVHPASRHELADRLRSRLGLQAVGYLDYRYEHLPEEAVIETQTLTAEHHNDDDLLGQRPFWLLPAPQPIHQEAAKLYWNGPLEVLYGPERIEDQWWSHPVSRDYYVARTAERQPIWIYQDRHNRRWYLHGLFA
jgi:protein ImuB